MKKIPLNWIFRTAAVLLVLVLMTSHLSAGMMARYRVTSSGGDGARVAKFEVERSAQLTVNGINIYMDPTSAPRMCLDLTIVNKSETAIRCTPKLGEETTRNLPLTYYWATDNAGTQKVTEIEIAPNDSAARQLYLFAEWSDEAAAKSFTYHREIDYVQVIVACEQID